MPNQSWVERLKKFYTEEVVVCSKCGHLKENHWWNGGGRSENSGYDACHSCECSCMGEEKIIKIVVNHQYMIDFISHLLKERDEEVVRMIEGMEIKPRGRHDLAIWSVYRNEGYNQALTDLKTKLKGE